jgi:prolipoprotein diacylglyceryltransferase
VPIASIALDFDPILRLGDVTIRWQAVALTAVVLVALGLTALRARRAGLRADDLLFIVVGVVPGAVIGGRLGYALGHVDYYRDNPGAIVDPAQGSATLALAVLGGMLTGATVARLLGTPIRPWLHAAALPVLLAIGLGKLAMVLAGTGQGSPTDLAWATSYVGRGPWGSLAPEIASHPVQAYEGLLALGVALVVALTGRASGAATGRSFLAGIGLWAIGRFAIGFAWRDAAVAGPLRVEQLIALAVVATCAALLVLRPAGSTGARVGPDETPSAQPEWPDPATRPRF